MTATDLRFASLQSGSTDLRFGDTGGAVEYFDLTLTATLVSAPLVGSLSVDIDNAVLRAPTARCGGAWQNAVPASHTAAEVQRQAPRHVARVALPVVDARPLPIDHAAGWGLFEHLTVAPSDSWRAAVPMATVNADFWANLSPRLRPGLRSIFEAGTPSAARTGDRWISLLPTRRPTSVLPWVPGRPVVARASNPFSPAVRHHREGIFPWREGAHPAAGVSPHGSAVVPPTPPCYTPPPGNAAALLFRDLQTGSLDLVFKCPDADGPAATVVVPVRRVYMQSNVVTLALAETGQPIPARELRLSLDVDSWVWGWSASVPAGYLPVLSAGVGDLVELVAGVNGTTFRLAVERLSRDRKFGESSLAVSGRGRAAWLADPYAEVISRSNAGAMTAQQLMTDALTINGVPIGWDIDWQITDWLVPAGAWNHTGTALEACLAIAEAGGAYVQAHRSEQVLSVLPRYPAAPWAWSAQTPDIELPEDACETEGIEWLDKPDYNTVFVSGQQDGILAHVTRQGTAGDKAAPMITHPLITHTDAGRQAGLAVLADTGRQKRIALSLPVLPETGIIVPGKLVRYTEGGSQHLGLTRAVDVTYDLPVLTQTIQVESHVL